MRHTHTHTHIVPHTLFLIRSLSLSLSLSLFLSLFLTGLLASLRMKQTAADLQIATDLFPLLLLPTHATSKPSNSNNNNNNNNNSNNNNSNNNNNNRVLKARGAVSKRTFGLLVASLVAAANVTVFALPNGAGKEGGGRGCGSRLSVTMRRR
jgi:multidrug efflux pump subunit AcrB